MRWPWRPTPDPGYRAFTTVYDRVVTGETLTKALGSIEHAEWTRDIKDYEDFVRPYRTTSAISILAALDQILAASHFQSDDWAVSVLADHSGSLKGSRAIILCFLMEMLGELLSRTDVAYELLAFTTSTWKGGEARRLWQNTTRARHPGRLADLLHIIYRDAQGATSGAPFDVRHVLRPALLKENIDGEAVAWAAERLQHTGRKRQLLLVLSDGAPVDDSTLTENPPDTLFNHLKSVVADLKKQPNVAIAGIGIDYDTAPFYSTAVTIKTLDQACAEIPPFFAQQLSRPAD